jgi:hypothetical protein
MCIVAEVYDNGMERLRRCPLVEGVGDRSLFGMRIPARRPAPTADDLGSLITQRWNHLMEWLERLEKLRPDLQAGVD